MAEEEVVAAAETTTSPPPSDLKRKHNELEPEAEINNAVVEQTDDDVKRPRLEEDAQEKSDASFASENGLHEDKEKELVKEEEKSTDEKDTETAEQAAPKEVDGEQPATDDQQAADIQPDARENPEMEDQNKKPSETELQVPSEKHPEQVDNLLSGDQPASDTESVSRKIEVPNNKVGVLIGKGGETIRSLQYNSGAKIQIMRDADVKPESTNSLLNL